MRTDEIGVVLLIFCFFTAAAVVVVSAVAAVVAAAAVVVVALDFVAGVALAVAHDGYHKYKSNCRR